MDLAATLIVVILLAMALVGALAFVLSRPKELRPHRPAAGKPSARMRFRRRQRPSRPKH